MHGPIDPTIVTDASPKLGLHPARWHTRRRTASRSRSRPARRSRTGRGGRRRVRVPGPPVSIATGTRPSEPPSRASWTTRRVRPAAAAIGRRRRPGRAAGQWIPRQPLLTIRNRRLRHSSRREIGRIPIRTAADPDPYRPDRYPDAEPDPDPEPYRYAEPYRPVEPYRGRGPERSAAPLDPGAGASERDLGELEADAGADEDERYTPRRERDRGRGLDRRPRVGESRVHRRDPDPEAPSWERPRRYEAYPTLKTRVGLPNLPRIGVAVAAIVAAAAALFFLPPLFLGLGDEPGTGAGASSRASAGPSVSSEPTPLPSPTPQTYVIKKGDTLSKIATRFGVTIEDILAANEETIKDADRITVGQEIVIPLPPSAASPGSSVVGASPSP